MEKKQKTRWESLPPIPNPMTADGWGSTSKGNQSSKSCLRDLPEQHLQIATVNRNSAELDESFWRAEGSIAHVQFMFSHCQD